MLGLTWLAGDVWASLVLLHRGPLVHVLLSYPDGRARGRVSRGVVVLGYAVALLPSSGVGPALTLALLTLAGAAALAAWARERGRLRRAKAVGAVATVIIVVVLGGTVVRHLSGLPTAAWPYELAVVLVTGALLADLVRGDWSQAVVTELVVQLGAGGSSLRDRLAAALGDEGIAIGFWLEDEERYVDENGAPVRVDDTERVVTPIHSGPEQVAVVLHDGIALQDPLLLEGVSAVVRLSVGAVRLQAQTAAHAEAIASSRRRVVDVAAAQRSVLERDLQAGPGRRLRLVSDRIALLAQHVGDGPGRAQLEEVQRQLQAAQLEVQDLARGIRPEVRQLRQAVLGLTARVPLPVDVQVSTDRCSEAVGIAAYFLCSELLTNAIKHAHATRISIWVSEVGPPDATELEVVVSDDGVGGASVRGGSGLLGLQDRVQALDGTLVVESPAGRGTRITARMPVE